MKVVVVEGKIDVREEVKATAHLQWVLKKKKQKKHRMRLKKHKQQGEVEKNERKREKKSRQ